MEERDVLKSGAIFRMKPVADGRWKSPLPLKRVVKENANQVPDVEKRVEMTPKRQGNEMEARDRVEHANTPASPRRGAFESLCLRSPMPKILLEKLQNQIGESKVIENDKPVPSTHKKIKYVFKAASAIKLKPTPSKNIQESSQENMTTPVVVQDVQANPVSTGEIASETTKQVIQSLAAPQSPFVAARMQSFSFMSSPTANIYHTPTNQSTSKRIQTNGESPTSAIKSAKRALSSSHSKNAKSIDNESPANPLRSAKRVILTPSAYGIQANAESSSSAKRSAEQIPEPRISLHLETQHVENNNVNALPTAVVPTPSRKPPRTPAKTPKTTEKNQIPTTIPTKTLEESPRANIPQEMSTVELNPPAIEPGAVNTNITVRKKSKKRKEIQATPSNTDTTTHVQLETSKALHLKRSSPAITSKLNKPPAIKNPMTPSSKARQPERGGAQQKKKAEEAKESIDESTESDISVVEKKTPLKRLRKPGTPTPIKRPAVDIKNLDHDESIIVKAKTPTKSPKSKATPSSTGVKSLVDLVSSDTEESFVVKDVRKDPLAKFFSFHDVPSSEDESEDVSMEYAPQKPSNGQSEDNDVDMEEERVELTKWWVVWPPRIKSASNVVLSIKGMTSESDSPKTFVYKSYRSSQHFLAASGEEVCLKGTMEKNSKILPSVRTYFKNGIPRLWRKKIDSLLVVNKDVKSKSKPIINSLGSLIDSNSDDSQSDSDESSDSSSSSASQSLQSPLEKAIKGKRRGDDVKPRQRASKQASAKVTKSKAQKSNDDKEMNARNKAKNAPSRKQKIRVDQLKAKPDKSHWSSAELVALKLAVQHVPPSTRDYWNEIADRVESKSSDQCRAKHFETIGATKKPKKSQGKSAQPDKLSRAGTVKRKIQVRKFVKELEERTADDVFASTPVKRSTMDLDGIESPKSNKKIKRIVQYDKNTSEDENSSENEPIFSPITFSKRNDVDSYINQLSKPGKKLVKKVDAKPQSDHRMTMAMETKVGSRALVGTMTPNGTTRVRISHDSDFSDSVDISYDIDADSIDQEDEKDDDEGSEYSVCVNDMPDLDAVWQGELCIPQISAENAVVAMVSCSVLVKESKAETYCLEFHVKSDQLELDRRVTTADITLALKHQQANPTTFLSTTSRGLKADKAIRLWIAKRKAPCRDDLILWLLERMVLSRGRLELACELGLTKEMLQPKVLSPHRISSPFNEDDENEPLPPFSPHKDEDVEIEEELPPFSPEKTMETGEERDDAAQTTSKYKYEPAKEQNNNSKPSEWSSDAWRLCLELKKSKADLAMAKELRRRQELVANARRHQLMVSASKLRTTAIKNKQDKKLVQVATKRVIEHHEMLAHIEKQTKRECIQYMREHERTTRLLERGQHRKWQKGPHLGPGPLPTDVFGDAAEPPCEDFIYDLHGRRHEFTSADRVRGKSVFDSAMKKIQRVAAKAGHQLFHLFKKHDKDKNGVLDRKEFAATLLALKIQLTTDQINALFEYFDRNGTRGIDYGEFMWSFFNRRAFLKKWEMKTEKYSRPQLHAQFYQADKANRGALTSREFFMAMNRLGFHFSTLDEAILLHQFDKNGDGFIDFNEFEAAFSTKDQDIKEEFIPSKKKSVNVADLEKELDALTAVQERLEKLLKQV